MKLLSITFAIAMCMSQHALADALVRARVSPQVVEAGETFTYTIEATTDSDAHVSSPGPGKTKPFKVVGRTGTSQLSHMSVVNGQVEQRTGLSTSLRLEVPNTTREGEYTLGPASADIDGKLVRSSPVKVKVVKAGQGQKRSGSAFFNLFGDDDPLESLRPHQEEKPEADPSLALPKADGALLFFRLRAPKTKIVVGEVLPLALYEYGDPQRSHIVFEDIVQPTMPDFVTRVFEGQGKELGVTKVGGESWTIALAERWALVPLRAGKATISPFRVKLSIAGRPAVRETGPLTIEVVEPPLNGRPPGYELGCVGDFKLTGQIAPRTIDQGGAVTLSLELSGFGNFPTKLTMPVQSDVEFSDPEVKEDFKFDDHARYGGTRRYTYVVRMARAGRIALGKVVVPFFDASTSSYRTTEVDLGVVEVRAAAVPGVASSSPSDPPVAKLASLPEPRKSLEGTAHTNEGSLFGFRGLAFSGPFILAWVGLADRARRWWRQRASRKDSPLGRLVEARQALSRATGAEIDVAIERVLHAALALHYGLSVRGMSHDAMRTALETAEVPSDIVSEVVALSDACGQARYMPGTVSEDDRQKRVAALGTLLEAMKKEKR